MRSLKEKILQITAFTVFALFMNFTVLAQSQEGSKKDTTRQDKTSVNEQTQAPSQEQNLRSDEMISQDPDEGISYSDEVEKNELSDEINSSLKELYPAHQVEEVHKGDDDSYRVKVKNKDDEAFVYYNSDGSFIRARNTSESQSAFPQQQSQRTNEWGTDRKQQGTQRGSMDNERGTSTQSQGTYQGTDRGTGTQSQGTRDSQWGTGTQSQGTQQGSQSDDWDTGTQNQGTQQGTQGIDRGTSTQGQGTYQRSQQDTSATFGTDADTTSYQGSEAAPQEQNQKTDDPYGSQSDDRMGTGINSDDASDLQGTTQGTLENWDSERQNTESSAYPQSQNQRSEGRFESQSGSDIDTETSTQSDAQRGRLGSQGTTGSYSQSGLGSSDTTTNKSDFGGTSHSTTTTQGQYGAGQETESMDNQLAFPQSQAQRGEDDGDVDYSEEIEQDELPETVASSIKELYPAHDIDQAYRGDDDSFKVKVKNDNDKAVIYYNSNGDFLRAKNLNEDNNQ
ncbi:MAG TPA: PepSY-like domain-containing protein [Mariniphaga sp.]|nr:PepSY-like domain-containing protein [Mariniphaga sp.]